MLKWWARFALPALRFFPVIASEAKQSIELQKSWIASSLSLLATTIYSAAFAAT
jgi:hypothetical protein